jgi:hypothetical protein
MEWHSLQAPLSCARAARLTWKAAPCCSCSPSRALRCRSCGCWQSCWLPAARCASGASFRCHQGCLRTIFLRRSASRPGVWRMSVSTWPEARSSWAWRITGSGASLVASRLWSRSCGRRRPCSDASDASDSPGAWGALPTCPGSLVWPSPDGFACVGAEDLDADGVFSFAGLRRRRLGHGLLALSQPPWDHAESAGTKRCLAHERRSQARRLPCAGVRKMATGHWRDVRKARSPRSYGTWPQARTPAARHGDHDRHHFQLPRSTFHDAIESRKP